MKTSLRELLDRLEDDPWRQTAGFNSDLLETQQVLFKDRDRSVATLNAWIQKYQPCLFGRAAAKLDLIRYCLLWEEDITTDEAVRDRIQESRLRWTADAFDGKASGFIVLLVSPRVTNAVPNAHVLAVAERLCSLYLRDVEVEKDCILHERVWLEKPGPERATWQWLAGVNYFCAQGDKRWWHDHRIPGGMAFSVNSVGHLVRASKIAELMDEMNAAVGVNQGEFGGGKVRSLEEALKFAMLTIDNASEAVSGPATELLPLSESYEGKPLPTCPIIKLPDRIEQKNHCDYQGWYHTDYTIPGEYFRQDVERPAELEPHLLDFTYLFHNEVDNPAYETMGTGRRIRAEGELYPDEEEEILKTSRMTPREVMIDKCERLEAALAWRENHQ